jgi:hypothetical protein
LVTVIGKVPPVVRSPAGSIAVILLVLTKTDGRAAPLKLSVAPGAKFAPVRVNVTPELPAATESGVMLVMDGVVSEGRKPPEARPMGKESWSCCMRSSGQSSPPPMPKMSSATLQAESSTPPESVHHGLAEKSTPSWRNASGETDGVRISSTRTSIFAPPYTFAVKLASKTTGSSVNWWVQVSIGENWPPPYESPRVSDAV